MLEAFHDGEIAIQERVGERDIAIMNGRNMGEAIPPAAVGFVAQQQSVLLGWTAPEGRIWATFVAGDKGFARTSDDRRTLALSLRDDAGHLAETPPFHALKTGDDLGALFIEFGTRRRLRVNGTVAARAGGELSLAVERAYALCPKYIQRRTLEDARTEGRDTALRRGAGLDDALTAWITAADTFFVASAHPDGPADVSHRGGKPGFVRVDDGKLRIPDYPGNSMFNTFGNLALNPRAGLVFVDFEGNRQLQLTGEARLDLEAGDVGGETGGTGRWWDFVPAEWIVSPLNRAFAWRFVDASPFNP